ncbi:TIR domain-containing protein [Dickeya oryzae]|uniref:TIR domain-containing protein n=1 Tax=Dickeya oryzae TaxID=1240404 RepID=UPI0005764275|nr:TIR domain-containing protein [Dickeya oryzae]
MARETFISYKYSEAQGLRDDILKKLGDAAKYYRGETADSPDISNTTVGNIKKKLKDMIFGTSVTILIVSPEMINSKWIDWEIKYSMRAVKRDESTSRCNGIVGVIMKINDGYDWLVSKETNDDGCIVRSIKNKKLLKIVNENRYNLITENHFSCPNCKTYSQLDGSFISLIDEDDFLENSDKYIENAFDKAKKIKDYNIVKVDVE